MALIAVPSTASTGNLLQNPAMNSNCAASGDVSTCFAYDACTGQDKRPELWSADAWTPYFACPQPGQAANINRRPEYRPAGMDFPNRVRSAPTALKYFNFWALNQSAGVYQRVQHGALRPGARVRFEMWVQAWSSNCDGAPNSRCEPGYLEARLCLDTNGGGLDMGDPAVVCAPWTREEIWDQYALLSLETTLPPGTNGEVLAILNSRAEYAVKHNDIYADDASLVVLDVLPATPAPRPPPTVRPPAPTPRPPAASPAPPALGGSARVRVRAANLRSGPGLSARRVGLARFGTVLTVLSTSADGRWLQVLDPAGEEPVWISTSLTVRA
jgi:hypothetical protein